MNKKNDVAIIREFELSLYSFLFFQNLRGFTIIYLQFDSKIFLKAEKNLVSDISTTINTLDFAITTLKKTKNLYKYKIIFGFRSIVGYNHNMKDILEVIIKTKFGLPEIFLNEINEKEGLKKSLATFFKNFDISDATNLFIFNRKDIDGDIVDAIYKLCKAETDNNYFVVDGKSLAEKLILSKSLSGTAFLFNYLNIRGYNLAGKKVIEAITGKIIYADVYELIENWEEIVRYMFEVFPVEMQSIDVFKIKEEILLFLQNYIIK